MDNVLITMPDSPREFFLAMPVAQAYLFQYIHEVKYGQRDTEYNITYRMRDEYSEFELALKVAKDITPQYDYTGWSVKNRSEFTCFLDFDFEAAKKIAYYTNKHIVEAMGILLGCTPRKQPLIAPPRCSQGKGILFVNWDDDRCLEETAKLHKHFKDSDSVYFVDAITMDDIQKLELDTCSGIIGPTSALTHLVAAYNRPVIEIFSDVQSYMLYNNEGITTYQAVITEPRNITADLLISAWREMTSGELQFEGITNVEDILS